jgi:hypothetical protein
MDHFHRSSFFRQVSGERFGVAKGLTVRPLLATSAPNAGLQRRLTTLAHRPLTAAVW